MTTILAPRLFDGERFHDAMLLHIEHGRIATLAGGGTHADIILPERFILAPGYIDLQVNGGGGRLLNDGVDVSTIRHIAHAHALCGTTSLLPTLITATRPVIREALDVTRAARQDLRGVLGLHVEGPFISPARKGIHPLDHITEMTDADEAMFVAAMNAGGTQGVLLLTLAPEIVGAARIGSLRDAGIVVFAGHTDATAEQAAAAFDGGVAGCTHLFNAMSQMGSRAPGVVGAALAHDTVRAGLICDGLHVHPAAMRAAFNAMGPSRLFFVSDAMPTAASDSTSWVWQGETIRLQNNRLARADGTLAGAHITMAESVRNGITLCGLSPAAALRMATLTPAEAIGADNIGRIAPGCRADLVVLDEDFVVRETWQGGLRLA